MERLADLFLSKVDWPSAMTSCWPWKAWMTSDGYGRFTVNRTGLQAHRVSYELFRGRIPDGLHLDHLCRVRKCVNPLHLEAVPKIVNDLRGESPQAINARKTHCDSGHEFTEQNTYRWVRPGGRVARACRSCRDAASRRYKARRAVA